MARPKIKAKKKDAERRNPKDPAMLELWSDIELRQCSPHLCGICDFHGDLVICDGPCHRQFHHVNNFWETVGKCPAVLIAVDKVNDPWYCPECKDARCRCFKCGIVSSATR